MSRTGVHIALTIFAASAVFLGSFRSLLYENEQHRAPFLLPGVVVPNDEGAFALQAVIQPTETQRQPNLSWGAKGLVNLPFNSTAQVLARLLDSDHLHSRQKQLSSKRRFLAASKPNTTRQASPSKSILIVHIGPGKTGTTSLQNELGYMSSTLRQDGYAYAGKCPLGLKGTSVCRSQLWSLSVNLFGTTSSCWPPRRGVTINKFVTELNQYRKAGMTSLGRPLHVLLSDECYVGAWSPQTKARIIQIRNAVAKEGWELQLVVSYRHFFDWAISKNFQENRIDSRSRNHTKEWPDERHPWAKSLEGSLVFPNHLNKYVQMNEAPVNIKETVQGTVPGLHVLNMHDASRGSMLTDLVCHILPDANRSCYRSLQKDSTAATTMMHANGHDQSLHLFYDIVTTAAADAGMIQRQAYSRAVVRKQLQLYAEHILHHESPYLAFDLACPNATSLEELRVLSHNMQQRFFAPMNVTDEMKQELDASFDKQVASQSFCWVDTEATLRRNVWKIFFARYQI